MDDLKRKGEIELTPEEFKEIGYGLVDRIAEFLKGIENIPITKDEEEDTIRRLLKADRPLPGKGTNAKVLLAKASDLLINHSLFNGHPRFWGYITSSPAPIGILGDFLSSAINANVGAWALSPMASEIEAQTVRWIGELIHYPSNGGLIVSGGAVANYIGFIAGLRAKTNLGIREKGIIAAGESLKVYCVEGTHTWIQKAADLFGLGTENIRWIQSNQGEKMDTTALRNQIREDVKTGHKPVMVVGTAGSVSTGTIDPLEDIAECCEEYNLWFHIDGAYGGFAAAVPELKSEFSGMEKADSVAVDPHKWLYAPLEAGCVLVRNPVHLTDAFSYHPPYYNFEQSAVNYVDYGIQNSRGFKALKVWLSLQQMGSEGYQQLIREDIKLARYCAIKLNETGYMETPTNNLSITTFRFIPTDLKNNLDNKSVVEYLNELNRKILENIESSGQFFVSNAIINDVFYLRLCIVNFRTKKEDIDAFSNYILETGFETDAHWRESLSPDKAE